MANGGRKFLFMEGNFHFKQSKSDVTLVAWGKEHTSYAIDWQELHKSIVSAAEQVIQYLDATSCSHQDLSELKGKYSLRKDWLS